MSLYAIADIHLSLGTDKPMDIFSGWEDYIDRLEKNWKRKITSSDTVVLAGDVSWALSLSEAVNDFRFLESLPGKKVIMKGNHDYWWSTKRKVEFFLKENGFSSIYVLHNCAISCGKYCVCGTRGWVCSSKTPEDQKILDREVGRLKMSVDLALETGLEPVVFLHYPPICGSEVNEEIVNLLIKNDVKRCYYGHLHGKVAYSKAFSGNYEGIEFKLLSADSLGFDPIKIDEP